MRTRTLAISSVALLTAALIWSTAAQPTADPAPPPNLRIQPAPPEPARPPFPWETESYLAIKRRLAEPAPQVSFDAESLESALTRIAELSKLNLAPNWTALEAVAVERDAEVSLRTDNKAVTTYGALINLVLDEAGGGEVQLQYDIVDGVVRISTREDLSHRTLTHTYDCWDLLTVEESRMGDYIGRVFREAVRQAGAPLDPESAERAVRNAIWDIRTSYQEELAEAIRQSVDSESWREAGGNTGSIAFVGTKMIIVQTQRAHEEIYNVLESLRDNSRRRKANADWP